MASVSDVQLRQLKKFMDDASLTCTSEWLVACVNWIQENFTAVNLDVLKRELRVQWKDTNLEEMESSCLPINLAGQRLAKLPGKYGLQVNSVRDIGESSYSQWTKLKKLENENTSVAATDSNEYTPTWQPTPKRILYLNMTDGKQQVFGMEMLPIPGLSLSMKPGIKILILGPVECRRGVLHLRPNNVRIEGGEVDDLLESNRTEKILSDILKVPPDNNRSRTQTTASNVVEIRNSVQTPTFSSTNTVDDISGDFPDSPGHFPDEPFGDDDDIFMEIDEEALINSAAAASTAPITPAPAASSSASANTNRPRTTTGQTSRDTKFKEEIEDFEDDPCFLSSTHSSVSSRQAQQGRSVTSTLKSGASSSSTAKGNCSTSSSTNKSKPVFVPPPSKGQTTSTKNKSAPTSLFSSKKSTSGPSSSSSAQSSNNDSKLPGFSSAKTALSKATSGNSGKGKQMKILTFMKPMPVIIDPPTPERQLKRRRKSLEEGVATLPSVPIKVEEESEMLVESEAEAENDMSHQNDLDEDFKDEEIENENDLVGKSPDDDLMRIVDQAVENRLSECFQDDSFEEQEALQTGSSSTSSAKLTFPLEVHKHPYVFIQQIQENETEFVKKRKCVNVKACISTVVSNIKLENGCWTLEVCINDGTGFMNCKISANVLNNIIGFSPTEMKAIKATKSKEGKQKIAQAMNGLAGRLVHLNAIFSIEIVEQPMIVGITAVTPNQSAALKEMLSQVGL